MMKIDFLVSCEKALLLEDEFLQQQHQLMESTELFGSWLSVLEIPHQADADTCIVDGCLTDVTTPHLVRPAWSHLDFPIAGILPAADDEMIGKTVWNRFTFRW